MYKYFFGKTTFFFDNKLFLALRVISLKIYLFYICDLYFILLFKCMLFEFYLRMCIILLTKNPWDNFMTRNTYFYKLKINYHKRNRNIVSHIKKIFKRLMRQNYTLLFSKIIRKNRILHLDH